MNTLDCYKVDLKGISTDKVAFNWHVDDAFFSVIEGPEITHGNLDVDLEVSPKAGAYELAFHIEGNVSVLCDRCMEPMDVPIVTDVLLKAKMGDTYEDDGDFITVPYDDGTINVAWHIYETAALEIPIRHVHPDGECAYESEQAFWESNEQEQRESAKEDPRWSELRKILDNNNK